MTLANTSNWADFDRSPISYIHPERSGEWFSDLPQHLVASLSGNQRLRPRLSEMIARHYHLPPVPAVASDIDHAIAALDARVLETIIAAAGAVWYGHAFAKTIDKASLAAVLALVDEKTYRFAVEHAELAPPTGDAIVSPPTADALNEAGRGCFIAWIEALPEWLGGRVALKFPAAFIASGALGDQQVYGPAIVRKCADFVDRERKPHG
ncbi:hypothetical protein T281_06230 [Rhodomicrobium udaipurense JA643]|uniref:SctK family type III secretion system sorting platform protein n=1 Tax=Rhodomicrobium udaipurense TaxID=1202716 RepID=A0A8I1GIL0_9HYPH|nr:SctK family type III secretion system sorting platform protein [Rhodomicrobium udaipurense]KAI95314.1 hypothetical protein T281_06230 [Rhodomicrobium udaipurense JA643]MBJ7544445.1 SctK family type III secretion system sorting platform protein [Rhodomicrobium udaipurense]